MNFDKMSKKELEEPVKGYQLLALYEKLNTIDEALKRVLTNTEGVVTQAQLEVAKKEQREYTDDEIEKIHLEYRPLKNGLTWFTKTLIGAVIGQVVSLAGVIYLLVNK